ncbi:unnamed protein product [Protopolystoma xenopodis]|uniref:Uncharacterized protein n=1 Tax=Protopolystoma xenopodis TaxID=117903 RepID=A0A3S5AIQ4_9PLAT|nr:unnamed protein product [Protopolystoma xenopodis]
MRAWANELGVQAARVAAMARVRLQTYQIDEPPLLWHPQPSTGASEITGGANQIGSESVTARTSGSSSTLDPGPASHQQIQADQFHQQQHYAQQQQEVLQQRHRQMAMSGLCEATIHQLADLAEVNNADAEDFAVHHTDEDGFKPVTLPAISGLTYPECAGDLDRLISVGLYSYNSTDNYFPMFWLE